jgi:hypothetical protein
MGFKGPLNILFFEVPVQVIQLKNGFSIGFRGLLISVCLSLYVLWVSVVILWVVFELSSYHLVPNLAVLTLNFKVYCLKKKILLHYNLSFFLLRLFLFLCTEIHLLQGDKDSLCYFILSNFWKEIET